MPAVLRNWCLSVDEPVRGSTPALRHPWLARHTNPEALVDQGRCEHYLHRAHLFLEVLYFGRGACWSLRLCSLMFLEDWHSIPMLNEYRAGVVASELWMAKRPNRVRKTRRGNNGTCTVRHTQIMLDAFDFGHISKQVS